MSYFQVGEDSIVERRGCPLWFYIYSFLNHKANVN